MTKNGQDELARAYATLSALRKNIDKMAYSSIEETFVHEFHSSLDKLTGIGIDVSEFRVPDSEVRKRETGGSYVTGEKWYTDEKYVDKHYLLTKLDAVLEYFEIITSEKPKRIGFHTSKD